MNRSLKRPLWGVVAAGLFAVGCSTAPPPEPVVTTTNTSLVGPQGYQGPAGPAGPQGPIGPTGARAT
jgi:hypothetical protein